MREELEGTLPKEVIDDILSPKSLQQYNSSLRKMFALIYDEKEAQTVASAAPEKQTTPRLAELRNANQSVPFHKPGVNSPRREFAQLEQINATTSKVLVMILLLIEIYQKSQPTQSKGHQKIEFDGRDSQP